MRTVSPDDTAFRMLAALGELWDNLKGAGIDPGRRGVQLRAEYLGGYLRVSAGPGAHARVVLEWHEATGKIRVLRNDEWAGMSASVCATVKQLRDEARTRGLLDVVDRVIVKACSPETTSVSCKSMVRDQAAALAMAARRA